VPPKNEIRDGLTEEIEGKAPKKEVRIPSLTVMVGIDDPLELNTYIIHENPEPVLEGEFSIID